MNNIITKTNAILNGIGNTIYNAFGIIFGGKTFIKTISAYDEIIVMD